MCIRDRNLETDISMPECDKKEWRAAYCNTKEKMFGDPFCRTYCMKAHSGCVNNTTDHLKRQHCAKPQNKNTPACACINYTPKTDEDRELLNAKSPSEFGDEGNPACFASECNGPNVYHLDNWWSRDGFGNRSILKCSAVTICNINMANTTLTAHDQAQFVIENNCGQDSVASESVPTEALAAVQTPTGGGSGGGGGGGGDDDDDDGGGGGRIVVAIVLGVLALVVAIVLLVQLFRPRQEVRQDYRDSRPGSEEFKQSARNLNLNNGYESENDNNRRRVTRADRN